MTKANQPDATGSLVLKIPGVIVYRLIDWTGRTLYVGMTDNLCQRMAAHCSRQPFWEAVARVDWEEWPDRDIARGKERDLIHELKPPYNVLGSTWPESA